MTLFEIIMKLIGSVRPYGASHIDSERNENLTKLLDLHEKLTAEIIAVSKEKTRQEASMKIMGERAQMYLKHIDEEIQSGL